MKWNLINSTELKTYAVVFDDGDEVIGVLEHFAKEKNLQASQLSGIGAW